MLMKNTIWSGLNSICSLLSPYLATQTAHVANRTRFYATNTTNFTIMNHHSITHIPKFATKTQALTTLFKQHVNSRNENALLINNTGPVTQQYMRWKRQLPYVNPHYAVKCNPDPVLIQHLANLNSSFDCASWNEIKLVLNQNVEPHRIIFANPIKSPHDLRLAQKYKVLRMTFDNEEELQKIKEYHPDAHLVIRIAVDDSQSIMKFSSKFGARLEEVQHLLQVAKRLDLNVIGCSFHIGSSCQSASAFEKAIADVKHVFTIGTELGFPDMYLVDIGGGFGQYLKGSEEEKNSAAPPFESFAAVIDKAIKLHFNDKKYEIISEPGRNLAGAFSTLFARIEGKRMCNDIIRYYINQTVYGPFNCIFFDHAKPVPLLLSQVLQKENINTTLNNNCQQQHWPFNHYRKSLPLYKSPAEMYFHHQSRFSSLKKDAEAFKSEIHGKSCDVVDIIIKDTSLPQLSIGDWLVFDNFGAYTQSASSNFNGIELPQSIYCRSFD